MTTFSYSNRRGQLYGKIKAHRKVCEKAWDKALKYRALSELYIVDTSLQRKYNEQRLMYEAKCQQHDETMIRLYTEYQSIEHL
jgi:stalled ribosome rescue protein Dom34